MSLEWHVKRAGWKVRSYLATHAGIPIRMKKYNGKVIRDEGATGAWLRERILSGKAFCAARLGGTEIRSVVACQPQRNIPKEKQHFLSLLQNLSGFFGDMEDFERFARLMESSLKDVDLIAVWYNQMEDYLCLHYGSAALEYGTLAGLEPWYVPEHPWTAALRGKKVLVIHPFDESIQKQYERRDKLFPGSDILPEFELRTVKAVQTLSAQKDERFNSWFDALDHMEKEALREDFDVALIACGAYGLPLAVRLKQAGKQAVHMGGALQLLFGIMGARWENMPELKPFYNEYWIRPSRTEHLKNGGNASVENGCYW